MTEEKLEEAFRLKRRIEIMESVANAATVYTDEPFYEEVHQFVVNLRAKYIEQLKAEFDAL